MDKLDLLIYVLTIVVILAVVWVQFFIEIKIDVEAIPTLVNGITTATSLIIGFSGTIIGITFREMNKNGIKAKRGYITAIAVLLIPITMLWTTYIFLTIDFSQFAVKNGLSGLIFALYVFCFIMVVTTKKTEKNV